MSWLGPNGPLWVLVVAIVGGLASLVPLVIDSLKARIAKDKKQTELETERIEIERIRLRREAAFDGAALSEARGKAMSGSEKMQHALKVANALTPASVVVTPADVEAALPRVRASLPTSSTTISAPPGGEISVQVISSVPPPNDERTTNPIPPPRVPRDWRQP